MSVTVIKYGGSLLDDPAHQAAFLQDVAALGKKEKIVLVHGGGKEITRALEKKGIPARFEKGLRVTDEPTMSVVDEVLARINQDVVRQLANYGINASGFSGKTDHVLRAEALPALGRVGKPELVNQQAFEQILNQDALPVFYSVGEDAGGRSLNVNADDFAQALALSCKANRLVFVTDSGGILDNQGQLILKLDRKKVEALVQEGVITGGMIVKAQACLEAIEKGVGSVDITKDIKYLIDTSAPSFCTSFGR